MGETIKQEAQSGSEQIADLDNFRSKYLEYDFEEDFSVIFPSGEIYSFEHNKFTLLLDSKKVKFDSKWSMRPDYVSYDNYGTVIYWPVILFINNVLSIEEFKDLEDIYIPSYPSILEVISDRVPEDEIEPLEFFVVDETVKYLKRTPLDSAEIATIESGTRLADFQDDVDIRSEIPATQLIEQEDVFELIEGSDELLYKRVVLSGIPVNISSISLYLDDFVLQQRYGYDYTLLGTNIISWNVDDVDGPGIEEILNFGTTIRVTYLYEQVSG